jgi:outer membrane protein assembly factor BamB
VNRGAHFVDGQLYCATLDGTVVTVDAATGKETWRTRLGDINRGEPIAMAPQVVKDKVLVRNSGGNPVCAAG